MKFCTNIPNSNKNKNLKSSNPYLRPNKGLFGLQNTAVPLKRSGKKLFVWFWMLWLGLSYWVSGGYWAGVEGGRAVLSIMHSTNWAYCTYSLNIFFKYLEYTWICSIIFLLGRSEGLSSVTGGWAGVQTTLVMISQTIRNEYIRNECVRFGVRHIS